MRERKRDKEKYDNKPTQIFVSHLIAKIKINIITMLISVRIACIFGITSLK